MLDKIKVLHELRSLSDKLFLDVQSQVDFAYALWIAATKDHLFLAKVKAAQSLSLSTWSGSLGAHIMIESYTGPYSILAIDGSQIYPDKHQGTSCFLINIGNVLLHYGIDYGVSNLWSVPFIFVEQEIDDEAGKALDIVNGKREEFEFKIGLEQCHRIKNEYPHQQLLFLFDGSLIFWHLQGKDEKIKDYFLERYTYYLLEFYKHDYLLAGYISLSKGKDLAHLLRASLTKFSTIHGPEVESIKHITDSTIAYFFLEPKTRSTIFKSNAPITVGCPPEIQPHFFYYNTGFEIARIEIPGYIAQDETKINILASLIQNQVEKGQGYPIAIAEAHEQAVVRAGDREMFYQMVSLIGLDRKRHIIPSQKSLKKRRMSV